MPSADLQNVPVNIRYEMVFTCFLKDDAPQSVLDTLRWHMGLLTDRPAAVGADEYPHPLLTPNPDTDRPLPGGEFARLERQSRGGHDAWGLFVRVLRPDLLDDVVSLLELLAPHVDEPDYAGYFRAEADPWPSVFRFHEGTYGVTGPMSDFRRDSDTGASGHRLAES